MKMKLVSLVAAMLLGTTSAFATTLTGGYSVSEVYTSAHGGPTITDNLAASFSVQSLTLGIKTTPVNFFTASPASTCTGSGCSNSIETDALTVSFTGLQVLGITVPTFTETAVYTAKYTGAILPCANGDGVSPSSGKTDCIIWTGASNTYNGSIMVSKNLGNGDALELFLYNATDWNITPTISFELVAVPEPLSLAVIGSGLVGLGVIRRRNGRAKPVV